MNTTTKMEEWNNCVDACAAQQLLENEAWNGTQKV